MKSCPSCVQLKALKRSPRDSTRPSARRGCTVAWRTERFPPHWVGTTIRWDVEPRDDGSTVNFRHDGFTDDGHAGHAAFTWGQIMVQLKQYAESGRPAPVFA
jgi:hypothetical protein